MKPNIHPEDHVFPVVKIIANRDFDGENNEVDVAIDAQIRARKKDEAGKIFFCDARIQVKKEENPKAPYFIDVVCFNLITFDGDPPERGYEQAAQAFAHLTLYPAIRELILSVTARQPWGEFSIGAVSPSLEDIEAAEVTRSPSGRRVKRGGRKNAAD